MSQNSQPVADPLSIAALDTERHVATSGWDQNPRLFALVPTAELLEREPHLRAQMRGSDLAEGALSAIEQEDLPPTSNLETLLGGIAWPDSVVGAALAVERIVVPPEAERDLPAHTESAVDALASHPARQDVRLLVGRHPRRSEPLPAAPARQRQRRQGRARRRDRPGPGPRAQGDAAGLTARGIRACEAG